MLPGLLLFSLQIASGRHRSKSACLTGPLARPWKGIDTEEGDMSLCGTSGLAETDGYLTQLA